MVQASWNVDDAYLNTKMIAFDCKNVGELGCRQLVADGPSSHIPMFVPNQEA